MVNPRYLRSNIFLSFAITLLCFLVTYLFFGFYYVRYEGLFDSFYSGKLTPGMPFRSIYFLGNIGTSHLYSYLYELIPSVEWISWFFYGYLFLSCFIGLYIVARISSPLVPLWGKIVLLVITFFLVFADSNIHFMYTRVSYITCGVALMALVVFFNTPWAIKSKPWLFLLLNLFFTIGVLTRVESGTAVLSLLVIFGFFYLQNLKQFIQLFLYPAIVTVTLILAISSDIKHSTEFYKQIEPDIEAQFCERRNMVPISAMTTHRDSVMFKAARDIMWSDPDVMTPSYLRSLIRPEKFIYTDAYQWRRTYCNISDIIGRNAWIIVLNLLLAIALAVQYKSATSFLLRFSWLALELLFWGLIVAQTYTFKLVDHSFLPFIELLIFCQIILLIKSLGSRFSRWLYVILSLSAVVFVVLFVQLKMESNTLKTDLDNYRNYVAEIKKTAINRYLVVNATSCDFLFLSNAPFHPFDFSDFKGVYITDGYNIPFLPYYRRFLEKECSCNMADPTGFWKYLSARPNEVVIVSDSTRMNITREYLGEIHQYSLPVREDTSIRLMSLDKSESRGFFSNLKMYKLHE